MSASFSKFRLSIAAVAALAGMGAALVLASPGDAKRGDECGGKPVDITVTGTAPFRGTKAAEVIQGDSADNEIHGHNGNDTICGGNGFDHLAGGEGNDKIFGQGDNDDLFGRPGNDKLDGGPESNNDAQAEPRRGAEKGKFFGDGCYGGIPNPADPTTDPDIPTDCEDERGVRQGIET